MRIRYSEASRILNEHDRFLILTHKNPDGDALGSAAALCSALRRNGKTAYLYPNPQITDKFLPYVSEYLYPAGFHHDYVIAVDVASESQFPNGFSGKVDCCFDHHPSNTGYADKLLLEPERASCGELIWKLIRVTWNSMTSEEATLIYIALSTDTGRFLYSNTDEHAFRTAAELVKAGADIQNINEVFFRKISRARMMLEGSVCSSMEYYRDGRIVIATITKQMIADSGAADDDMDDLASLAGRAKGADVCITIKEADNGNSRVSVRTSEAVNSSDICAVFGGGGHARAAGCSIECSPEKAKQMLLDVIDEIWQ